MNVEEEVLKIVMLLEQAKNGIELLRAAKQEEALDGRALSISVTYLETSQLWLANARR